MPRPFDFDASTKNTARFRQWGLCAGCGESLDDLYEHAHHVIPNQTGDPARKDDAFLRSADNCVILCELCHDSAHDSDYRKGAVALADWFGYAHGTNGFAEQDAWVERVDAQWQRIIGLMKARR